MHEKHAFNLGNNASITYGLHTRRRNAAMQMGLDILQILRDGTVNTMGSVQIILVLDFDLIFGDKPGILRVRSDLLIEGGRDFADIPLTQALFAAVLHKVMAGINHKDSLALACVGLIQNENAGGNASAVEQVGWQADDALDIPFFDDCNADGCLYIATDLLRFWAEYLLLNGLFNFGLCSIVYSSGGSLLRSSAGTMMAENESDGWETGY